MMLDTTWHVIRQDVTTIVMALYVNVGVPLGFAFGVAETMELYQQHDDAFTELFGIDLSRCTLESDQGSALSALCTRHGQIQLICLRHFLLSLKPKEFSLAVGILVKFRTQDEFESLARMYEVEFRNVRDQKRLDLLACTFKRAGLAFIAGEIVIKDERRFNTVSMWKCVHTRMPNTTNSLKAIHGRLNEVISRRNPFWESMAILYDAIADKTIHFDAALAPDFRAGLKRCKRRSHRVPADQMAEECASFGTSREACSCGEMAIYRPPAGKKSLAAIAMRWAP
jgi:hypothetical protein